MTIEFPCSQCQCELRVGQDAAGKKARCPRCGMIHDVPGGADAGRGTGGESETVYRPAMEYMKQQFEISEGGNRWSMKTPEGSVYGPVHQSELDQWAREGRISSACLVQLEGQSHWQSALVLYPELADLQSPASPGLARPGSTRGRPRRPAPAGTRHTRDRPPRPNNGVTVLTLSIVGIFLLVFPVFSVLAAAMGHAERRRIVRGEVSGQGRILLDIGYALGLAGTFISIIMFFGCCFFTGGL